MKLLTKIFQSRGGHIGTAPNKDQLAQLGIDSATSAGLSIMGRHDVQIVQCLFSEFRQNIVPQICALIFLQGQIRAGHAHLEDFPLNLWDMERMYEGVYQYLEFFAILTERDMWKQVFAEWEVTSELITLIRELEVAIPKRRRSSTQRYPAGNSSSAPPDASALSPAPQKKGEHDTIAGEEQKPKPVSVERPYDVSTPLINSDEANAGAIQASLESIGTTTALQTTTGPQATSPLHDEPADFEWRNLKKLCVLVLSSLVWRNRTLQDQVRRFGGVTAILSCCNKDEHNPSIREHAIMCLRFLIEGNEDNTTAIACLSEKAPTATRSSTKSHSALDRPGTDSRRNNRNEDLGQVRSGVPHLSTVRQRELGMPENDPLMGCYDVPLEVTDPCGYETYLDADGDVALRRRQVAVTSPIPPHDTPNDLLSNGTQPSEVAADSEMAEQTGAANRSTLNALP